MIRLRPVTPEDTLFLRKVYATTRAEEMAVTQWPAAAKAAFLDSQFDLQQAAYRSSFPDADFSLILFDGVPAGRLYVSREPECIRLVDISLLPAWRGLGHGSALIRDLLDEAERTGRPVDAHVERFNRARRLYARLGFAVVEDLGAYLRIEWRPTQPNTAS